MTYITLYAMDIINNKFNIYIYIYFEKISFIRHIIGKIFLSLNKIFNNRRGKF